MMFNISGEVNIVAPPIIRYIDTEIQKELIRHYAAKTTPDRLVVVEPGAVLMRIADDEILSTRIEPLASLCIKNEYDCLIAIAFYDTVTEAEAARLQFIKDYNIENEEDFTL